jgi:hypothetical protein
MQEKLTPEANPNTRAQCDVELDLSLTASPVTQPMMTTRHDSKDTHYRLQRAKNFIRFVMSDPNYEEEALDDIIRERGLDGVSVIDGDESWQAAQHFRTKWGSHGDLTQQ